MKFRTTQKEYYTQHTHIFWIKPVFVCAKLDCTTIMDNEMRNDIEMVNHFYWFLFFREILFWSFFSFVVIGYAPFCFCFPFEIIVNNLFAIFLVVLLRQQSAIIPILFCCCFFFYWIFFCRPLWKCVCCVVTFHTNLFDCLSPLSSYQGKTSAVIRPVSLSLSHTHFSREFAIDFFPIYSNSTTILLYFPIQIRNKV